MLAGADATTEAAIDPTAVDVALAFMDARDRRDVEATLALVSPEAEILDFGLWPRTRDEYPGLLAWMDILDWRWAVEECIEGNPGPPTLVTCRHTMENAWSRALGLAPTEAQIDLGVDGGMIIEINNDLGASWGVEAFQPWFEWLSANHPEDIPTIYRIDDDGNLNGGPAVTSEALELVEQYLPEFEAAAAGTAS